MERKWTGSGEEVERKWRGSDRKSVSAKSPKKNMNKSVTKRHTEDIP